MIKKVQADSAPLPHLSNIQQPHPIRVKLVQKLKKYLIIHSKADIIWSIIKTQTDNKLNLKKWIFVHSSSQADCVVLPAAYWNDGIQNDKIAYLA